MPLGPNLVGSGKDIVFPTLDTESSGIDEQVCFKSWLGTVRDQMEGRGVEYLWRMYDEGVVQIDKNGQPYLLGQDGQGQPVKLTDPSSQQFRANVISMTVPYRLGGVADIPISNPPQAWTADDQATIFALICAEAKQVGSSLRVKVSAQQLGKAIDNTLASHQWFPLKAPLYLALLEKSITGHGASSVKNLEASLRDFVSAQCSDPNAILPPLPYDSKSLNDTMVKIDDYIVKLGKRKSQKEIEEMFLKTLVTRLTNTSAEEMVRQKGIREAWIIHTRMTHWLNQIDLAESQEGDCPVTWEMVRSFLRDKIQAITLSEEAQAASKTLVPSGTALMAGVEQHGTTGNHTDSPGTGTTFNGACGNCGQWGHTKKFCTAGHFSPPARGRGHPGNFRGGYSRGGFGNSGGPHRGNFGNRGRGFHGGRGQRNPMAIRRAMMHQSGRPLPDGAPPTPVQQVVNSPTPSTTTTVPAGSRTRAPTAQHPAFLAGLPPSAPGLTLPTLSELIKRANA